ncbi:hypothetical protein BDA96_03G110800 [Sorghum bicolor]|uniref:Alpha/beta hydrolase fold-3 domain-containing protein n=1 Tax=Sorghum bicolor TaxID=4558 RepID=A0A921UMX5_SORBI|nr:hypothetical protein BDA96_03G110800 [Sorghum bicolor]
MPTMPVVSAATGVSPPAAANVVVEDIYGFLRVLSDGTILRSPEKPVFCPATFPSSHPSVQWKEEVYDKANNLRVRMYKPLSTAGDGEEAGKKLPVLVHFHGGGFFLGSCTWANVHADCLRLAAEAGAVVLSAEYRLAPEHRLPAAVDDGVGFLRWHHAQSTMDAAAADGWLTEAADFGRVFVTGDSAGGNIAHHLAVRAGPAATKRGEVDLDLRPVTVRAYVLLMPFFGAVRGGRSGGWGRRRAAAAAKGTEATDAAVGCRGQSACCRRG